MAKARCLILDTDTNSCRIEWCEELEDFYKALGCDMFDIAVRRVGGVAYDIFCDDIGLWRDEPIVSAMTRDCKPMLVGNLVIANHNDQGETTSLTVDDVKNIMNNIAVLADPENLRGRIVLLCEY